MNRFNSPPGWPPPPEPDWTPPPRWQPDPGWPPAPRGWKFWVNERGARSLGPRGAYGAVGRGRLVAGGTSAAVALLVGLAAVAGDPAPADPTTQVAGPTATATTTVTTTAPARSPAPRPATTVTIRPKPLPRATVTVTAPAAPRVTVTVTAPAPTRIAPVVPPVVTEPDAYYENCAAARAAGVAPLRRGEPGYGGHLDRDDDGIACE